MPKEILKRIKNIEIHTRKLVDGLVTGAYHSVFKGRGIEFSEVREYVPGDDVRTIDWNVTARMDTPYIKEYIEERDLTFMILFDISGSSEFRAKKQSAIELIASLMFGALKNNDRVGLVTFTEQIEAYLPPRKGKKHILRMLRDMLSAQPQQKGTNLSSALRFSSSILKQRSIIFVVSDFYTPTYEKELRLLSRRHDVIALMLHDSLEEGLPDVGYVELEDPETGEQVLVNTSDAGFRESYRLHATKEAEERLRIFRKHHVDMIHLFSGEGYEKPLRNFFHMRRKREVRA